MNIVLSRILSSCCLLLSAGIGCSIPSILKRPFKQNGPEGRRSVGEAIMCLCNCMGGGVIMAMSFLHILPESVEDCTSAELFIKISENKLNLAFLLMLISFSFMLFLERVLSFGRTPCCADFNDCKVNTKCCTISDEESLVDKELKATEIEIMSTEPKPKHPTGSRYRHGHNHILSTIKKLLCPICECNGLCITLALFIHSVFEGIVVGLEKNEVHLWLITLGIVIHKWAAGIALASFMAGNPKKLITVMVAIFCAGSPLGVLMGSLILDANIKAVAILNSVAVGTLVYVGFEIIVHELFCEIKCKKTALYKWLSFMAGGVLIFGTLMLEFYLSNHTHAH
ncbi:zinc transport protein [Theileria orientalis]|uniref:Zinc transport protein n=1 Tax=Theileria orientalis TaxID=68886 RepID=A0A976MB63_THEOR|nr:zinc transport protein [Theileria orientalis]